jgi:hypothetical protein
VSYLKKLKGNMPKEIESKCYIPKAIIPLTKYDIDLLACGMDDYLYIEIEGNDIHQVRKTLCEELNNITSMSKYNQKIESLGFVLRCNSGLLWSEFHEIRLRFLELCKYGSMHFNYGVLEDQTRLNRISLSVFYFTGEMKRQKRDVGGEFINQVRLINKILH